MANAMLEDEFRSSHDDLMQIHNNALAPPPRLTSQMKPDSPRRVGFAEPPPQKRSRVGSATWSTKSVLQGISDSIISEDRVNALHRALETFDHSVQALHDDEIQEGADVALVKLLVLLIHVKADIGEIALTLQTLEAILRASSQSVGNVFDRSGSILLTVLVEVMDADLTRRQPNKGSLEKEVKAPLRKVSAADQEATDYAEDDLDTKPPAVENPPIQPVPVAPEQDVILQKALTILGHLARVGHATKPIAHHKGVLGSLIYVVGEGSVPWEARLTALWIIANLACHDENMEMIVCTPNLLACLVNSACRSLHEDDSLERTMDILRSRSLSSRAVLNLSWSASNKILLAEHGALVDMLCELAVHRTSHLKNSRTVHECMLSTRRHSVGALRNLAAAPRRTKIGLANYRNGRIFDILTDCALNDSDVDVKVRSFAAIHNMATHDTAEQLVNHPALVLALKGALIGDQGEEAKKHASSTLMVLERTITSEDPSYGTLRELLDALDPSPTIESAGEPKSNPTGEDEKMVEV